MSTPIYHKHHIVPRHMGGSDDSSNLIKLTIEEHAEAHKQLFETHGLQEDYIAWKALSGQISFAEATILAIKLANTGRKRTDEVKKQRSEQYKGTNNPFYGKTHSKEFKEKQRLNKLGKPQSEETKAKYNRKGELNAFYGKTHSDEFKEKQRINRLGRKDSPETKEKKRQAQLRRYNKV